MKYYCWMQYYDNETHKQTSSDEIKYADGHQHGVQPTQRDWDECLADLIVKVNDVREKAGLPPLPARAFKILCQ